MQQGQLDRIIGAIGERSCYIVQRPCTGNIGKGRQQSDLIGVDTQDAADLVIIAAFEHLIPDTLPQGGLALIQGAHQGLVGLWGSLRIRPAR